MVFFVNIAEFKLINVCWTKEKVFSDNTFVFSNREKYIVLCAGMGWDNLFGYMLSSLFTKHKVMKWKDKFSRQHIKKISRTLRMSNYSIQKEPPEVFCKKAILKNFAKFTGKHLCQSLFFHKVACLRPATLVKTRLWHRCLLVNFAKFLKTLFITEYCQWLLLSV